MRTWPRHKAARLTMSDVVLAAIVYFGPVVLTLALLRMRRWVVARRARALRLPAWQIIARVEHERRIQRTNRWPRRIRGLPVGWCWPERDVDESPPPAPARTR